MKITYAAMPAEHLDEVHRELDRAVDAVQRDFGRVWPHRIGGRAVTSPSQFDKRSPHDTRLLLARVQEATPADVDQAVAAAAAAAPDWGRRPWRDRVAAARRLAEAIRRHRWELSALMGFELGKNRLECVGDVEETADLIAYYCDQVEAHDGFVHPMSSFAPEERTVSVMRPYGVFAVISPFNFPLALAGGPAGAALVAGNTVVLKPASDTPLVGLRLADMAAEAELPAGVFNVITGGGSGAGQLLVDHTDVAGVVFTGSRDVGMRLIQRNAGRAVPRPCITEMGGKNPAIVMDSADLEAATEGVMRSAFGAQGQKCSACSRVYVANSILDRFLERLAARTADIAIGNPLRQDVWLGPVVNARAVDTYERAVAEARADGGTVVAGGRRLTDGDHAHGHFVAPTVVAGLPPGHRLFTDELFVPITAVAGVDSLDEALALANRTSYGLTAGIFTRDPQEIDRFFERIEAGVVYANRRSNATAGSWPGVNSFGGWKASGSTGRGAGGPYYMPQFLREQSRVRVDPA